MSALQPISSAPTDGTRFIGSKLFVVSLGFYGHRMVYAEHETWYGKTSHVPLYGWCRGEIEDVDLWEPTHWKPITKDFKK